MNQTNSGTDSASSTDSAHKVKSSSDQKARSRASLKNVYGTNSLAVKIGTLVFGYLFMNVFRFQMLPTNTEVTCFKDYVMDSEFFTRINRYLHENDDFGIYTLIFTQYLLDAFLVLPMIIWFKNGNSYTRWLVTMMAFYLVRGVHINFFQFKFPDNHYWKDTKWPCLATPYENLDYSDFYFSGHCGGMTLSALELHRHGYKRLAFLNAIGVAIMGFIMIAIRMHYWIDITAGIVFAHYLYIMTEPLAYKIDRAIVAYLRRREAAKKKD